MALTQAPAELLNLDSGLTITGTTPFLVIGDAGAEDTKIVFDGNAQDYYIGLDDSSDELIIGRGATVGTTPVINISNAGTATFQHPIVLQSGATQGLYIENNAGNATTPRITNDANDHTVIRPGKSGGAVQWNNFANDAELMRLDDSGRLGIGATPEAWSSTWEALQVGARASISSQNGNVLQLAENTYNDGSNWKAVGTDAASLIYLDTGTIQFYVAPSVSADANQTFTQKVVISNNGWVEVNTNDQTSYPLRSNNTHASFNGWMYGTDATRAGSSDFYMFVGRANIGSATDNEFLMRGDGNAYADGAWNGGGADYAEYFEWKDGNSDSEDRRGYPVVLDGNMIRKATSDDVASSIIGIVSTAPAIVGDSDTEQYKQKYLKDDFGSFIWEDYTVTEWDEINFEGGIGSDSKPISYHTDQIPSNVTPPSEDVKNEDGQVVKTKAVVTSTDANGNNLRRRKLNPDYDSSKSYETRESRKEWEAIGLMGKLRMRKGQPTGDRWIKMKDITDSIEEWLVR